MSNRRTSRELACDALAHRESEKIPWTLYLAKPLQDKMVSRWGPRQNWPIPPDDTIRILWNVEACEVSSIAFKDPFGCDWKREHGGYIFVNPPLAEPDASQIPSIDLVTDEDVRMIRDVREKNPDQFIFYQFTGTFGERLWCLRGLEQTLMDYVLEPKFVHDALDRLLEMHVQALDKILDLPIEGITFGDDFGSQRGLMISRNIFLEYYKPRYAKLYKKVRAAGKVVGHHSCGDNTELLGDFIDIGLEIFHPLQPEAMDIRYVKKEFGRHLAFRGGIGTQGALVFGTPSEAKKEVREAVAVLSKGGGYFLETAKPIPEETSIENVLAIIEELVKVSRYDFS